MSVTPGAVRVLQRHLGSMLIWLAPAVSPSRPASHHPLETPAATPLFHSCSCCSSGLFLSSCSVAEEFYDKLKQRAQSIKIGDPLQPGCRMGPVVSAAQYERVRSYVQVSSTNSWPACSAAGSCSGLQLLEECMLLQAHSCVLCGYRLS